MMIEERKLVASSFRHVKRIRLVVVFNTKESSKFIAIDDIKKIHSWPPGGFFFLKSLLKVPSGQIGSA
jgi:hypothetical protein